MGVNNISKLPYEKNVRERLQLLVTKILAMCNPEAIILFGSYARFEHKVNSDLDILVITKRNVTRFKRAELCADFETLGADLIFYTEDAFQDSKCLLVQQIRKDGILLWKQ